MVHRAALVPLIRLIVIAFVASSAIVSTAFAQSPQTYSPPKPHRQFVTVSLDWLYNVPLHFAEHPLEDLVGTQVSVAHFESYDYRTRDDRILIDVLEYKRRTRGGSVTVYPFGLTTGSGLAIRGSIEGLPVVRVNFAGQGAPPAYAMLDGTAYDAGIGVFSADRSAGWGLGSHAFFMAGAGRITSDLGGGSRVFAEGGGGLNSGPFGVELSVKFAWNRLSEPVVHKFFTVPITIRGTFSF